jgi:MFS family permease
MATFAVLFAMNLLDYMDRNLLFAVLPQVKVSLGITNAQAGRLATYFLVAFSIFSPIIGFAGDRMKRTRLLALGVGVWSLATVASGLAQSYGQLATARMILGIGEATYGVIAPTILLDLFPRHQRARMLSAYYLAMPIGSALGITLGGYLAKHYQWHWAFFIAGAPGLIAAFSALLIPEPVRGLSEGIDASKLAAHEKAGASWADYRDLLVNSSYNYSVLGMTAYTFAIGGLLVFIPSFLVSTRHMDQDKASFILGATSALAAIVGMSIGGWVADRWSQRNPGALFIVPAIAMLAAAPFVLVGLFSTTHVWIFGGIFLAETLMFVNTGPLSAIIGNVVAPNMRAAAYAICTLVIHFLGDIWSPWLIGEIADYFGKPDTMATPLGQWLARWGAVAVTPPGQKTPENLTAGLLVVVPAIVLSGLVMLGGARHLPREMALMLARLKATRPETPAAAAVSSSSPPIG